MTIVLSKETRDRMSLAMQSNPMAHPYSRAQSGWKKIGGKRCYFRSSWELLYARYLQFLKQKKDIKDWQYEPTTFWFKSILRGTRSYKPDFLVIENDGRNVYHEVKGWMDDKSKTKLKRMAKYHPEVHLILVDGDAIKTIKKIERLFQ